jgi:sugar O-acyltransferase (sialic acid O-acetyltransferase NeuD family)
MNSLLILGAGGHAKVLAETAFATGQFSRIAFLDDRCANSDGPLMVLGWPVLGPLSQALEPSALNSFGAALVGFGHASMRLGWIEQLSAMGYILPVLVHPTAWVSPSAEIGLGSVVLAQAAVQAEAVIGTGTILNTGCSVDHDSRLAAGVHVCPGARLAGEVQVGRHSWIGIGASVIQQIRIGSNVTVGAGAAVVCDLPDGVTAKGVPARVTTPV